MNFRKQAMSDKFQIGCRTYLDETGTDVQRFVKPATMEYSDKIDVATQNKNQPIFELLSSDGEVIFIQALQSRCC